MLTAFEHPSSRLIYFVVVVVLFGNVFFVSQIKPLHKNDLLIIAI